MNDTRLRIGLFGFGTVGQGLYTVIARARNAHAEIKRICVRDVRKPRRVAAPPALFTDKAEEVLRDQR